MSESKRIHVLIVEDEHAIASSLARLLSFEGFDVKVAHNGREGVDAVLEHEPDLIISDVLMPVMDGISMVVELQSKKKPHTPVILYSNLSINELCRVTKAVDVVACLPKAETSVAELLRVITRALGCAPERALHA